MAARQSLQFFSRVFSPELLIRDGRPFRFKPCSTPAPTALSGWLSDIHAAMPGQAGCLGGHHRGHHH